MKKALVSLALMFLVASDNAHAQQSQAGRYQMLTTPAAANQPPEIFLLNTETGQSWTLSHAAGQPEEWLPVRFSSGKGQALVP